MIPKITVLMAVYNGGAYLKECMDSVLGQTYGDFEFLIVNDASADNSAEIIKSYKDSRIRLVENSANLSQVVSLNIGLDYARGEYIARIDADDLMMPRRLKRQLGFLTKRPHLALAGSYGEAIDESGKGIGVARLPVRNEEIIIHSLFSGVFIMIHSSLMFRKKPVMDVGKYNAAFSFTEDYKLAMDLFLEGHKISNIPEVLIRYRIHPDRISVRDSKPQIERYIIAYREFLGKFTGGYSKEEKELLFDFLMNGSGDNIKKAIGLSDSVLADIADYFKFSAKENYFARKIFYNKLLNFLYQGRFMKKVKSAQLYRHCLRNCFFILDNPKLYFYPFKSILSAAKKND